MIATFVLALAAAVQCNQVGVNGEFFGEKAIDQYEELIGMPVKRTDYEARTEIKATFENRGNNFNAAALVHAEMTMKTTRPTINLVNFLQIQNVKCSRGRAELVFDSNESAQEAFKVWTATKDLTMMVGQQYECDGHNVAFLGVSNLKQNKNVLQFRSKIFKAASIIADYQLDISKYENSEQLFDWDVERELAIFPLNANYDPNTKTVTRPEIPLWENEFAQFACVNCHTRGDAKLRVLLTGSSLKVKTYKIQLDGGVTANIELKAGIKSAADRELIMVTLYTLALNPVNVPGIFKFGPELRIKAGASYGSSSELAVSTGFEVHFPFNFQVFSNNGITAKPEFAFNGKPAPKPHPVTLSKGSVHLNAHLIPEVYLGVEIVSAKLDVTVAMDNVLGAEVSAVNGCSAAPVQVLLYHQHSVGVNANVINDNYNWPLWNTGRLPITCIFCNKCPRQ
jgi:hypothetical protein